VTLGQDESIAIFPFWICGIVTHHIEKQSDQDFYRRQSATGMAGFRRCDHFDDLPPCCAGDCLQLIHVLRLVHGSKPLI
jgi:hypothetical protein